MLYSFLMTAETLHNSAPTVTPSQEKARALFVKEYAKPEDGLKRIGANAGILVAATGVDLAESYVAEKLIDVVFDKRLEHLEAEFHKQTTRPTRSAVERKMLETKGIKMGVAFVEDSMSDALYAAGMNAMLRSMTGMDHAEYVSEASAFASEWANVISLVFGNRPKDMKFYKKSENFVNPVNVEAGVRILKELPLVGGAVSWAHDTLNHALHKSTTFKTTNTVAAKFVTGYHIQKNMMGA